MCHFAELGSASDRLRQISFAITYEKHYPALGSDTWSVSAGVIQPENQLWGHEMSASLGYSTLTGPFFESNLKITLNVFSLFLDHYTCRQGKLETPRTYSPLWSPFISIWYKNKEVSLRFRDHIYSHNLSLDCVLNYRCCCYRCLYSLTRRVNIFPKNYFESSFVRIKYLIWVKCQHQVVSWNKNNFSR